MKLVKLLLGVPDSYFAECFEVDACDSPVTIFAFAGGAGLYFGRFTQRGVTPSFEFRRVLRDHGSNYNLVFFRDLHRSYYQLTPDGKRGGLSFYADKVQELMAKLGSTYHVAVGSSMGGGASLYFGARCRMDQVIAFSPALPDIQRCPWNRPRTAGERLAMLRHPMSCAQYAAFMLIVAGFDRRFHRLAGDSNVWPVLEQYRTGDSPRTTIYYGSRSFFDQTQTRPFDGGPRVECVPIACSRHNCASVLKEQGKLGATISDPIERGLAQRKAAMPGG